MKKVMYQNPELKELDVMLEAGFGASATAPSLGEDFTNNDFE